MKEKKNYCRIGRGANAALGHPDIVSFSWFSDLSKLSYQMNTHHLSKEGQRRNQDEREQIGREAAHVYQPFSRFPVIAASPKWFATSFFGNL